MKRCVQLRAKVLGAHHPYTLSSSTVLMDWEAERLKLADASLSNAVANDSTTTFRDYENS
jgi:hypothetical protein